MEIIKFVVFLTVLQSVASVRNKLPNILVLLADDLGYGDVACYGNTMVKTPNIDKLAAEGIQFTRMYAQPMCSPSRATLLTGRLPPRSGMMMGHLNIPVFATVASNGGIRPQELTIARMLQKRGYKNAAIGKWHVGNGQNGVYLPMGVGFESFYGTPSTHLESCSSYMPTDTNEVFHNMILSRKHIILTYLAIIIAFRFMKLIRTKLFIFLLLLLLFPIGVLRFLLNYSITAPESCILYRGAEILEQPYKDENMTLRTTIEAIKVLEEAKTEERPFFLYMSFLTPHVPSIVSKRFNGTTESAYYDSVAELDWSIGKIMDKLKELGFDDNTFVYFTSDNGPQDVSGRDLNPLPPGQLGTAGFAKDVDGKEHKLRGMKGSTYEGGIRVPGIVRWNNNIPEKVQTSGLSGLQDLLPTIAELTEQSDMLKSYFLDGKSLLPLLKKPETNSHHDFLFHWCSMTELSAVSHGTYKLHFMDGGNDTPVCRGNLFDSPKLYDMSRDPGETTPLALKDHKDVVERINQAVKDHEVTMQHPKHGRMSMSQFMYPPIPWQFPCGGDNCRKENTEKDNFSKLL